MRVRLLVFMIVALLALAPVAQAQDLVPRIGIYGDLSGTICQKNIPVSTPSEVYLLTILGTEPHQPDSLRGAEF